MIRLRCGGKNDTMMIKAVIKAVQTNHTVNKQETYGRSHRLLKYNQKRRFTTQLEKNTDTNTIKRCLNKLSKCQTRGGIDAYRTQQWSSSYNVTS